MLYGLRCQFQQAQKSYILQITSCTNLFFIKIFRVKISAQFQSWNQISATLFFAAILELINSWTNFLCIYFQFDLFWSLSYFLNILSTEEEEKVVSYCLSMEKSLDLHCSLKSLINLIVKNIWFWEQTFKRAKFRFLPISLGSDARLVPNSTGWTN